MSGTTFEKLLKVGKKERYTLGISSWLGSESLTSATVTACGSLLTINSSDYSGSTIGFFATGVTKGSSEVIVSYATATRSDSIKLTVVVTAADACRVP